MSVASQRDAAAIRMWALNQGFYNLFLALGAVAGTVAVGLGHRAVGVALTGGARFLRPAAVQAVPPLVALAAIVA